MGPGPRGRAPGGQRVTGWDANAPALGVDAGAGRAAAQVSHRPEHQFRAAAHPGRPTRAAERGLNAVAGPVEALRQADGEPSSHHPPSSPALRCPRPWSMRPGAGAGGWMLTYGEWVWAACPELVQNVSDHGAAVKPKALVLPRGDRLRGGTGQCRRGQARRPCPELQGGGGGSKAVPARPARPGPLSFGPYRNICRSPAAIRSLRGPASWLPLPAQRPRPRAWLSL